MLNFILDTRLLLFYYILYKYVFSFYKTINLFYSIKILCFINKNIKN